MNTEILISLLERRRCSVCEFRKTCDETVNRKCLLPEGAVDTIRDLQSQLRQEREKNKELQRSVMRAESEREYMNSRMKFWWEMSGADKMITTEGYKAFRRTMRIKPMLKSLPPMEISGDWLYKPETGCWYGSGRSYSAQICEIVEVQ